MNGKGSRPRNNHTQAYRDNWDHIFRKPKPTPQKHPTPQTIKPLDMPNNQEHLNQTRSLV